MRPDEATVRAELTEWFDTCNGCRACAPRCPTFPLMFDLIEGQVAGSPREAGDLFVAEQDRIIDSCTRCGACVPTCPHGIDAPVLADRALAMRRVTGQLPWRRGVAERVRAVARRVSVGRSPR